tara:strand:+ start:554 stop:904 length:351 start_codon:yes stop_codon:yes gene_type:complete
MSQPPRKPEAEAHLATAASLPELGRKYTGVTLRVMKKLPCGNLQQMDEWKDVTGCFRRDPKLGCFCFTRTFPSGQVVEYGLHTASQVILFALEGTFEHPSSLLVEWLSERRRKGYC